MSNFAFLAAEFPAVHEAAVEAERQAGVSPTVAAFFAGKAVEVAVKWAFRTDPGLKLPYQDNIAALLHEPSFRRAAGEAVFTKARYINTLRNRAVHEEKTISTGDAAGAVKELFHVCFWLARTYARKAKPADGLVFDASVLSRRDEVLKKAFVQLKAQDPFVKASSIAHDAGRQVALTLSDSFCVDRYRGEFLDLMRRGTVDLVFANEAELHSLYQTSDFDTALSQWRSDTKLGVVTRSEKGCVVASKDGVTAVPAFPIDKIVDTTGAGDLFAAGFLFGLVRGAGVEAAGRLGALAAAEVIQHIGARPQVSLKELAKANGLPV